MDGPNVQHPLSVGEIFDRALTVYVRNWRTFSALAAIVGLGSVWSTYQTLAPEAEEITGSGAQRSILEQLRIVLFGGSKQQGLSASLFWGLAVWALVTLIVYPAFLIALRAGTDGRSRTLVAWIAPGLRRITRLLALCGLWLLVGIGVITTSAFLIVVSGMILGRAGIGFAPFATILVLVMIFVGCSGLSVAVGWSTFVAIEEDKPARTAMNEAFFRAMRRGRYWRTTGIALALVILDVTIGYVLQIAAWMVFVWTKSALLASILHEVLDIPPNAYVILVTATYFLDARLRDSAASTEMIAVGEEGSVASSK